MIAHKQGAQDHDCRDSFRSLAKRRVSHEWESRYWLPPPFSRLALAQFRPCETQTLRSQAKPAELASTYPDNLPRILFPISARRLLELILKGVKNKCADLSTWPFVWPMSIEFARFGFCAGMGAFPCRHDPSYLASAARTACFFWRLTLAQRFLCALAIASRASALSKRFAGCAEGTCFQAFAATLVSATARPRMRVNIAIAASISLTRFPLGLRPVCSLLMNIFSPDCIKQLI
jgi:hypothetical protein